MKTKILLLCLFIANLNFTPASAGVNYFEVLGVSRNATDAEIKNAYRKLMSIWHPDKNRTPEAKTKAQEINEAYEFLSDPKNRPSLRSQPQTDYSGFSAREVHEFSERMKAEAARRAQAEATRRAYSQQQSHESIPEMAFHEFTREYRDAQNILMKNPLYMSRFSLFYKNHFVETLENLNATNKSKIDAVQKFAYIMGYLASTYNSVFEGTSNLHKMMDINFVKMSLVQNLPASQSYVSQIASTIKDQEDVRRILDKLLASHFDQFLRAAHGAGLSGFALKSLLGSDNAQNLSVFQYMIRSQEKGKFIAAFFESSGAQEFQMAKAYLTAVESHQRGLFTEGRIFMTQENIQLALRKVPQNTPVYDKLHALLELVKEVETKNHQKSSGGSSCNKFF